MLKRNTTAPANSYQSPKMALASATIPTNLASMGLREVVRRLRSSAHRTGKEGPWDYAGDHPSSEFRVKRVLVANPEYRTVSVIATALAAGALEKSSFTVKNIYKMKEEGSHAA